MAGFVRRYNFFPGTETIALIEGVIIVDLPPPGAISGVSTGVVGLVGEFADVSSAVKIDGSGNVTTHPKPVEIFSGQDMINKLGGFTPTLGDFANSMGNGFVAIRNKRFARLTACAINNSSPLGVRMWRQLPTNAGLATPVPVVPMQPATINAATEFRSGVNRVLSAQLRNFTDDAAYKTGVDGVASPAGLPLATQDFTSATGDFVNAGARVGDALVLGVLPPDPTVVTDNPLTIGAVTVNVASTSGFPSAGYIFIDSEAIQYASKTPTSFTGLTRASLGTAAAAHLQNASVAQLTSAGTYRVAVVVGATTLTLQRQDGSNFTTLNWIPETAQPYRLHDDRTADTGVNNTLANAGGFVVPARPLDASIAQATNLNPAIVPASASQRSWDPLSGLTMRTHPTAPGLAYDATMQASNAVSSASLDALYSSSIDSYLGQDSPERDVNLVYAARTSTVIRAKLKSHASDSSQFGVGRVAIVSPPLTVQDTSTATGDASPGVGATRSERVFYSWPGALTFIPEAANVALAKANGGTTLDGILDVQGDGWLTAVCSNLPPERNPGQGAEPVPTVMSPVLGIQRGVPSLTMQDYIVMRQRGVAGLRIDRTVGPIFQSGITSSLVLGQKNIARRRMADFIEDSLAQAILPLSKLPLTDDLKDSTVSVIEAFMLSLLSPNNPPAQRISDYQTDRQSGNTPDLEAQGIFVVIVNVRSLASADFFVIQASVGEGVVIVKSL